MTTQLVNGDRLGAEISENLACCARQDVPARSAERRYCGRIGWTCVVWPDQDPLDKRWKLTGFERTVVGVVKNSGANVLTDGDSIEAYVPIEGPDLDRSALILHTPVIRRRWCALFRVSPQRSIKWSRSRSSGTRKYALEPQTSTFTPIGSIEARHHPRRGRHDRAGGAHGGPEKARTRHPHGDRRRCASYSRCAPAPKRQAGGSRGRRGRDSRGDTLDAGPQPNRLAEAGYRGGPRFRRRPCLFRACSAMATLSPARRALRIDSSTTSRRDTGCRPKTNRTYRFASQTNTRCSSGPRLRRLNPPTAHGFLNRVKISQAPWRRSNPHPPTVASVPPVDRLQLGLKKKKL